MARGFRNALPVFTKTGSVFLRLLAGLEKPFGARRGHEQPPWVLEVTPLMLPQGLRRQVSSGLRELVLLVSMP